MGFFYDGVLALVAFIVIAVLWWAWSKAYLKMG